MSISIVIVNWNAGSQLADAVSSIVLNHCNLVESVIIVDNASSDDSVAQAKALTNLPFKMLIIRNAANCGFAKACNQGARESTCKYLLFLNPDAALFADTISKVYDFMQDCGNAKVGICGVQLLDETGSVSRSCARFPSAFGFFAKSLGLDAFMPGHSHSMSEWDHSQSRQVDHVIGAFFFVRLELFQALNGFDERFFVYLEDLDFSWRSNREGWSSMYLTAAQAFHVGGGTSNNIRSRRLFYSLQSRLVYAKKHFSVCESLTTFVATMFFEPIARCTRSLCHRSVTGIKETLVAYYLLWCWLLRQAVHRQ